MRRGLDWYKREQRAILDAIRAAKMTDRQAAIYNIVLDLIYDGGGETPDDPRHIASYLSNVGTAAARTTIQQLVAMGKLTRMDGMLHQKRAENEAKTRRNLSETRAEVGRLGGISSGVSRRQSKEIKALTEASASTKGEAEKRREEKSDDGGEDARARDNHIPGREYKPIRERILEACGVDPVSGMTGRGGSILGTQRDMLVVQGWIGLGLTPDEIVATVAETMAKKRDGPPSGFKFFTRPMQELAAAKAEPQPDIRDITPSASKGGSRNARVSEGAAFGRAINKVADGLSAGTIDLGLGSRDPFAQRSG